MRLRWGRLGLVRLSLLAVAVGIVTGLGAVFFRGLIAFVHNLLFLGTLSVVYDSNAHTPVPHGANFVGLSHVPFGETFSREPLIGPQLPFIPGSP